MTPATVEPLGGGATTGSLAPPPAVVVLAAGRGSRLGPAGAGVPKWLVRVGACPIAHFHLAALRAEPTAWSRLVVVTGHRSDALDQQQLSAFVGRTCELVYNPSYALCNNWLSLACALDHLEATGWSGDICVLNSDLLLPPTRLQALLHHAREHSRANVLAIDSRRELSEEAMKISLADDGRSVLDIGKHELRGRPSAEFIGASTLAGADVATLRRILDEFARDPERRDEWYEGAYRSAIDGGVPFSVFEIETDDWVEIDDESDLRLASDIAGRCAA